MDKNLTEIFGEFTYPESMTYEELLDSEEFLKQQLDTLFLDAGAEHLDFTPLGDILMVQCSFEFRNLEILRDIAQDIASILPEGMRGRILCLEKNLSSYNLFWIGRGEWQEKEYFPPKKGPADAPINKTGIAEIEKAEKAEEKEPEEAQARAKEERPAVAQAGAEPVVKPQAEIQENAPTSGKEEEKPE